MRLVSLLALLLLFSATANATMIIIEPDDFEVGEQITSPYADIVYYSKWEPFPVYARTGTQVDGIAAPTGSNHMGGSIEMFTDRFDIPWYGLTFKFFEPIDYIKVWALNYYPPSLYVDCWAGLVGEVDMTLGCRSQDSALANVPTIITLSMGGSAFDRITFGGGNVTDSFVFDRVEAHVVSEPSTLVLFGLALVGVGLARRRRALTA